MMLGSLLEGVDRATDAHELKLRVMDEAGTALGAGATGLYLFGPDGNVTELHSRGVRDGFILAYEQLGRGQDPILERVLATGRAAHDGVVFRGEGWQRSPLYRACGGPWKIRHYLCAPIVVDGSIIGTLNLGRASEEHRFGVRDTSAVMAVCRRIGSRLRALSDGPRLTASRARASFEELGRQSAERTHVRMHAAALEREAAPLEDAEAGALWAELVSRHVTPVDYFDEGDRTYVLLPSPDPLPAAPRALTPREAEVVRRAAAGLANKEIAFELGISQNTVGAALLAARKKLEVGSRVKLVEVARRLGLA